MYRLSCLAVTCACWLVAAVVPGMAQDAYPSKKAVRLVVPFPPGGAVDTVARAISNRLGERLGQTVVIENKAGAGGLIGTEEVAHSAPDGYTVGLVFDTHAINHFVYPKMSFDTFKDLAPIALLASTPMTLTAANALNIKTLPELVERARSPKGLSCGHVGPGSSNQLTMIQLEQRAGFKCNQITYRGAAPMVADLIGGHIDMAFVALPVVMKQISSKTMTGIAVAAKNEVPQLPGAPTVAATYPGFTSLSWVGFVAPAKTPEDIVARLNKEVVATLREPEVKANLEKLGYFIEASSPKEFAELIRTQSERLGPIIKAQEAASR